MRRHPGVRTISVALLTLAGIALAAPAAQAVEVPAPEVLEARIGAAESVEVIEPHLARPGRDATRTRYLGWPIERVLAVLLGPDWQTRSPEIEFRALDGYLSRIPIARFRAYRAFLVHGRVDGAPFKVDVLAQNEKNVALGPHYLVWDNTKDAALLAEGATWWPYQVTSISAAAGAPAALLPGDLAERFAEEAALATKYCLNCHQLNGYGGEKYPIDLAERVHEMAQGAFTQWVLDPNTVRPDTTMPALRPDLQRSERLALAQRLFAYFRSIPAASAR